jgi:hypothetical protein
LNRDIHSSNVFVVVDLINLWIGFVLRDRNDTERDLTADDQLVRSGRAAGGFVPLEEARGCSDALEGHVGLVFDGGDANEAWCGAFLGEGEGVEGIGFGEWLHVASDFERQLLL